MERVIGHRDTGQTACPGALLYPRLDELREMVESGVAGVPSFATRLSATLADFTVDSGELVPVSGSLFGPDGAPLVGEPVEVQTNGDGAWRTSSRVVTGTGGAFAAELRPRKRVYVRLRYLGRSGLRRATSPRLLLRVRAAIELRRPPSRGAPGRRVRVTGSLAPRKRALKLVLQQHVRGRFRKVGAKWVSGAARALPRVVRARLQRLLPLRADRAGRRRHRSRLERLDLAARAALTPATSPAARPRCRARGPWRACARSGPGCARRATANGARRTRHRARCARATAATRGR